MPLSDGGLGRNPLGSQGQGSARGPLIVCVALSVLMLGMSVRLGDESPLVAVRGAFQTLAAPVRTLGSLALTPFQAAGNVVANLTADQETLEELREQNAELQARNVELEEAEATATRLQALLDLSDAYSLVSTGARIISGSTDSWTSTVTIDKGSSDGVSAGMPVMVSEGVIGQVIEAGATTSVVRLLSDESSSLSVMIQSSRLQGMLVGSATGQVSLTLIRSTQTVEVDDVVITSGLGGVFPKGLPVGRVTSVESSPGSLYLEIVVELFATDPVGSEEALVITSITEDQRATAEDIADADAQEAGELPSGTESAEGDDEDTSDADAADESTSADE